MDNNSCVSCKKEVKEGFTYCYICFKGMEKLNNCKGITKQGTPCKLKCVEHCCKFHCVKLDKPSYADVARGHCFFIDDK